MNLFVKVEEVQRLRREEEERQRREEERKKRELEEKKRMEDEVCMMGNQYANIAMYLRTSLL